MYVRTPVAPPARSILKLTDPFWQCSKPFSVTSIQTDKPHLNGAREGGKNIKYVAEHDIAIIGEGSSFATGVSTRVVVVVHADVCRYSVRTRRGDIALRELAL